MPAANAKEGLLDDIGGDAPAPAPEPTSDVPEPVERASGADAQPGEQEPARTDDRPEGFVRREQAARLQTELEQERAERIAAQDRFAKMVERYYKDNEPKPEAQEEDWGPDPDVDPVGALKWQRERFKAAAEAQRNWQQQTQQQTQAEQQWTNARNQVDAYYTKVVAAKPELEGLYQGLRESYAKEYAAYAESMGQPIIPATIKQQVDRQEATIIAWAYQNNVPIDIAIERLAASRGVLAKAAQANPGAQQPRDPATGQFTAEAEKAAKIAQSQDRNASLGAAPGAPVKKMTPAELAKMPEEEMWKYFESVGRKPGSKNFDREMGFRS
jgi:hypothetical protein